MGQLALEGVGAAGLWCLQWGYTLATVGLGFGGGRQCRALCLITLRLIWVWAQRCRSGRMNPLSCLHQVHCSCPISHLGASSWVMSYVVLPLFCLPSCPFPCWLYGSGKAEFLEAMHQYWVSHAGGRVPKEISIGGNFIDPWVFWREVWAWGGPDMINEHRVSATGSHCLFYLLSQALCVWYPAETQKDTAGCSTTTLQV